MIVPTDKTEADAVRELRGLELARRCKITRVGEVWFVPSETSRCFRHRVVLRPDPICTCAEFAETERPCHHVHAVRYTEQRERGERLPEPEYPAVVAPGAPDWVTPDLVRETHRVFQRHYPVRLSPNDVLAMILSLARLADN